MPKTAVLVDGGSHRKRAKRLWGDANPAARADELYEYRLKHITEQRDGRVEHDKRSHTTPERAQAMLDQILPQFRAMHQQIAGVVSSHR